MFCILSPLEVFYSGDSAGGMLKVMDVAATAALDHFVPAARPQRSKVGQNFGVGDRELQRCAPERLPARRHRPGGPDACMIVSGMMEEARSDHSTMMPELLNASVSPRRDWGGDNR